MTGLMPAGPGLARPPAPGVPARPGLARRSAPGGPAGRGFAGRPEPGVAAGPGLARRPAPADTKPVPVLRLLPTPQTRPASAGMAALWALLLLVAVLIGAPAVAALAAPVALVAAAASLRVPKGPAWRRGPRPAPRHARRKPGRDDQASGRRPAAAVAGPGRLGASVLVMGVPFAALGGPVPALLLALAAVGAAVAVAPTIGLVPTRAALAAAAPATASGSLVLARHQGVPVTLALVAAVCLYDAAAHLMGDGPARGWPGTAAGLATVAVLGFLVAAIDDPPFTGVSPWLFTVGAGVLAAGGVRLAAGLIGAGRSPALRRLDSLILAGPVWVLAVLAVLHR